VVKIGPQKFILLLNGMKCPFILKNMEMAAAGNRWYPILTF